MVREKGPTLDPAHHDVVEGVRPKGPDAVRKRIQAGLARDGLGIAEVALLATNPLTGHSRREQVNVGNNPLYVPRWSCASFCCGPAK